MHKPKSKIFCTWKLRQPLFQSSSLFVLSLLVLKSGLCVFYWELSSIDQTQHTHMPGPGLISWATCGPRAAELRLPAGPDKTKGVLKH